MRVLQWIFLKTKLFLVFATGNDSLIEPSYPASLTDDTSVKGTNDFSRCIE